MARWAGKTLFCRLIAAAGALLLTLPPLPAFSAGIPAGVSESVPLVSSEASACTASGACAPLTLRRAAEIALEANPDLAAANEKLEAARQRVAQALAARWPRAGLATEYSERSFSITSMGLGSMLSPAPNPLTPTPGPSDQLHSIVYTTAIQGEWAVLNGGRTRSAINAAQAGRKGAAFERSSIESLVIGISLEACIQHQKAIELHRSALEYEESIVAQLDDINKNIAAGLSVRFDRLQTEARLEAAREATLRAAQAIEASRTAVNLALGRPIETPADTAEIASFPEITVVLSEMQGRLLASNPALLAFRHAAEAAKHGIGIERSGNQPQVGFSGSVSRTAKGFPPDEKNWAVAGSLNWNLFDAGLQNARIDEARARHREVVSQAKSREQQLIAELTNEYNAWLTARQRETVCRKGLELAAEERRISSSRLEAGLITLTDHLDTQAREAQSRANRIAAKFDVSLSTLHLLRLSGDLTREFVSKLP